mmetsp:Transcript_16038/g.34671  ORF Transcript_16038/g.34671 Transcript_16038/m.34671 type:complete len:853 (-) Transcript_16038:391-2949(-)
MRTERRSSGGASRRASELQKIANEITDEPCVSRNSVEGSLLSDYARQEMTNFTPSSRERSVDMDLATAKEILIRKQAEKIASLEAKLANAGINMSHNGDHDDILSHVSRNSRGGSADTYSKKLSPEERLEQHRQRKTQENKYKEKTGVWDAPPPTKKEKSLTKKVTENDDLVLKLTSDPRHRKKIEEDEKKSKRALRKSFGEDGAKMSPSNSTIERSRSDDSGYRQDRRLSSRQSNRGDGNSSFSSNRQHHRAPRVSCDTCGSTRDCEPDVDNPGVFYCKSCWDEYECDIDEPEVQTQAVQHQVVQHQMAPSEEDPTHHALWVVHDNPQLGDKISYTGHRRMECMLETKEPGKKNCVRIVIGDIDFSGRAKHSGIGNVDGRETEVGAECIRIRNVKGYYVDHNQAATRLSRDKSIYEFHLGDESALLLTGKTASKSVGEFFKGCKGAIDVILDPQRDSGGWYPQKEARSGGRKIAPQFRSKGVGYIRLGDDMSENGLAFLSSNACWAFLSSVGSIKKVSAPSNKALPPTSKPSSNNREGSETPLPPGPRGKANSFRRKQPAQTYESDEESSDDESVEEIQKVSEVLKQLQSPDMEANKKWKDKAELLSHLGKGASREDGRHSRPAALNIIQDTLGAKNVNVHVIRSSLIAAGMIGVAMGGELVSQNSWKTIMIETLKLLKSKQCGTVAKTVLAQLHGRCFTLTNTMESVSHVLGVGLAASAGKGRKSRMSLAMESPKPRKTSANSANSIEVIEWLAETTERERNLELIDPILDRNGLSMLVNLFFSHVDHRDQRCRKNVLDGLMHCVLYGVQRLELDLTRVMRMCSGLKETNPKGWNQIFQNVKVVLEEEQR